MRSMNISPNDALRIYVKHRLTYAIGSAKQMSRLATTSARSRRWKPNVTSGKPNLRRCQRSTHRSRRNWKTLKPRSAISRSLSWLVSFVLHVEHSYAAEPLWRQRELGFRAACLYLFLIIHAYILCHGISLLKM